MRQDIKHRNLAWQINVNMLIKRRKNLNPIIKNRQKQKANGSITLSSI